MLLLKWCVHFGAGMLVLLQCAAVGVVWVLERDVSAAAGCCFRVLLSQWPVRFAADAGDW